MTPKGKIKRWNNTQGITLVELVLTVSLISIILLATSQFVLLVNRNTKTQMNEEMIANRVNLLFTNLSKEIRTAKGVQITVLNNSPKEYTIEITTPQDTVITYHLKEEDKKILKNGVTILEGVTGIELEPNPSPEVIIPPGGKVSLSLSFPTQNYSISALRRNPALSTP
ncbi:MAG: PulJ/GspJ family protein [Candidatus Caldatribacteriaceae bacterium]